MAPLLLLVVTACARQPDLPHFERDHDPTRLIADARAAHEFSLREESIEVPFGQRESGTRLVLALMQLAQARGATFVSDLEFLQVFNYKDQLVECSTRLASADAPAALALEQASAVSSPSTGEMPNYSTSVEPPRPAMVKVRMSEDVVKCKTIWQSYIVWAPDIKVDRNDVELARSISGPIPHHWDLVMGHKDQCAMVHVTHDVERWDFQVKLEWTPPDWPLITKRWSTEPLSDGEPRCYRTTSAHVGTPPRHRMRARLFYRSNYRDSGAMPEPPQAKIELIE